MAKLEKNCLIPTQNSQNLLESQEHAKGSVQLTAAVLGRFETVLEPIRGQSRHTCRLQSRFSAQMFAGTSHVAPGAN